MFRIKPSNKELHVGKYSLEEEPG